MNIISKTFQLNKLPNSVLLTGKDNQLKLRATIDFIKNYYQNPDIIRRIDNEAFLDLKIIDKQSEMIKIDDIREVIHFAYLSPLESSAKFIIIVNADRMNLNAANSLLKLLEEPPAHNYIFLIAEHEESLIATIVSRCVKLNFEPQTNNSPGEDILSRTTIINNNLELFTHHYEKFSNLITEGNPADIVTYVNVISSKNAEESWHYFTQAYLFLISKLAASAENKDRQSIAYLFSLYEEATKLFAEDKKINLDRKTLALTLINKLLEKKEEV